MLTIKNKNKIWRFIIYAVFKLLYLRPMIHNKKNYMEIIIYIKWYAILHKTSKFEFIDKWS